MGTFPRYCLFKAQIKENIKAPRHRPVTGEFPVERPVTRIFDVFFDLRLE